MTCGDAVRSFDVTGISNDKAFTAAVSLAQSQLARNAGLLRSKGVDPAVVVASYEIAGVDREGDASDKLNALSEYWNGYLASRVLAYLGGFPTAGLR